MVIKRFTQKRPLLKSWHPYKEILENYEDACELKPPSSLEEMFMQTWMAVYKKSDAKLKLSAEYRLCKERRWRADFAHVPSMTLIELEGGLFKGRHTNPLGYACDCEKYNAATLLGYKKFFLVNIKAGGLDLLSEYYVQFIYDFCKQNAKPS